MDSVRFGVSLGGERRTSGKGVRASRRLLTQTNGCNGTQLESGQNSDDRLLQGVSVTSSRVSLDPASRGVGHIGAQIGSVVELASLLRTMHWV